MKYINTLNTIIVGKKELSKDTSVGIFLHGLGDNARNFSFLCNEFLDKVPTWFVPNAPLDISSFIGQEAYAWYPKDEQSMQNVLGGRSEHSLLELDLPEFQESAKLVLQIIQTHKLYNRKIILAGFSQGGMVAGELSLLLSQDIDKYKDIHIDTTLLFSTSAVALKRWEASIKQTQRLPNIAVFHGNQDAILPLNLGQNLYNFWDINKKNNHVSFYTYDCGHTIPREAISDAKNFL